MSLRVDLEKDNMDKVMWVVRKYDVNPSQAINLLLKEQQVNDAWSKYNDKEGVTCKKLQEMG